MGSVVETAWGLIDYPDTKLHECIIDTLNILGYQEKAIQISRSALDIEKINDLIKFILEQSEKKQIKLTGYLAIFNKKTKKEVNKNGT